MTLDLPTETLTFLFTDIEGATRLWENRPDAMRLAHARHDALLRESVEDNRGHVFKMTLVEAVEYAGPAGES